jgi:hypothetical protein
MIISFPNPSKPTLFLNLQNYQFDLSDIFKTSIYGMDWILLSGFLNLKISFNKNMKEILSDI